MDFERFKSKPLMGIVRGIGLEELEPLLETVLAAGLETLEITMNTQGAPDLIARAREFAAGRLMLGAGTVLGLDSLELALDAGASFIVMPTLVEEVAETCDARGIPFFPGALTPQEIHRAWKSGASMVKVFPARFFGPEYFKEIKGPFADVQLLACGGISSANLQAYRANGADGFAFGGSVLNNEWMKNGQLHKVEAALRELIEAHGAA
jgi:2-dehydro-3-deoxyphosphogluconate aldolase/(4S)-4-hydroxy-2-oxoglutarate aldolase